MRFFGRTPFIRRVNLHNDEDTHFQIHNKENSYLITEIEELIRFIENKNPKDTIIFLGKNRLNYIESFKKSPLSWYDYIKVSRPLYRYGKPKISIFWTNNEYISGYDYSENNINFTTKESLLIIKEELLKIKGRNESII
jgi:hypothetical protein